MLFSHLLNIFFKSKLAESKANPFLLSIFNFSVVKTSQLAIPYFT